MKIQNISFFENPCTCENHVVLAPGSICEICNGRVETIYNTEPLSSPEISLNYDQLYFEELENHYEAINFAA